MKPDLLKFAGAMVLFITGWVTGYAAANDVMDIIILIHIFLMMILSRMLMDEGYKDE